MFIVRPYGASLWVSLADPPAYNPLEHLVTGSRLLYLGESTDYYVQVLSQSGKVGWVHRGNVIGAAMPSRAQMQKDDSGGGRLGERPVTPDACPNPAIIQS